jgi:DNA invertase Pin-like site-specific DNA recombinase
MKETIIYIRTSSEEQSPQNQIKDCMTLINNSDYEILEDKQSAYKDNIERENFNRILEQIKAAKIKTFIVWDLDRIYRNRLKLLEFFNICKTYGTNVLSFRQSFLNEMQNIKLPAGFDFIKDMMINNFLQFLGWVGEDESRKKSERVKIAVRRKDNITYSYKGNRWGRKSLSTQKQNLIKKLMEEKKGIRQISRELNISAAAVHKYFKLFNAEKNNISDVF